ncbi:CRAL-TRIO domain-containing protein [Zopfochytrium polystomum]|nr:CRAL-TRIO domain-containing protein [Zopfochytrium polystomum]
MGEGIPFLASVRGYKTVPDVDVDMNDPRHSPYFAKMYKCMGGLSFHKFDKDGLPLVIERVGLYDSRRLAHICTLDALLELHTDLQEYLFRKLMPEASDRKGTLVDKQCVIFDCTGMGLHQFYMPAMGLLRAVADNDAKYYPERLGRLFLVNSPPVFQKIWVMIKRWLDKGILEKVHILGSDYKEVLLKYIDADNLPEYLGGSCTCSHSSNRVRSP